MFSFITRWIEHHPSIHRLALRIWRLFPPRLAGFLKGLLARHWVVGAVAVLLDADGSSPRVLVARHSYRPKGAWGLPGGSLESIEGSPTHAGPRSADDVLEATLRREVWEELGIDIEDARLIRVDAIPYMPEEPGPYRLDFYFRCRPAQGFDQLADEIERGIARPRSPEISELRLCALRELQGLDLFTSDARFLLEDLPRLVPELGSGHS